MQRDGRCVHGCVGSLGSVRHCSIERSSCHHFAALTLKCDIPALPAWRPGVKRTCLWAAHGHAPSFEPHVPQSEW
eukprot:2410071-Pyramimonas_sp.AAC.1